MAAMVRYDADRISMDAGKVIEDIQKMRLQMSKLNTEASELDAMWDGESSEAFKRVFHEDMEALRLILDNLEKIYRYEIKSAKKFRKCDTAVDEIIAAIGL